MRLLLNLATIAALLVPTLAMGQQVASALVRQGDYVAGTPGSHRLFYIHATSLNNVGGYCWAIATSDTAEYSRVDHYWGDPSGGRGNLLRSERTVGRYTQTNFDYQVGYFDNGDIAYITGVDDTEAGVHHRGDIWLNDTAMLMEGEPYPYESGTWWAGFRDVALYANDKSCFLGSLTTAGPTGDEEIRCLFRSLDSPPVLLGGQTIPGLDLPIELVQGIKGFDFSASGTHYIAKVQTDEPSTEDRHMVVDGELLTIDGWPVSEGSPIPDSAGALPDENWGSFSSIGITDTGRYYFTARTSAVDALDHVVVVDGEIVWREGDVIDGYTVSGYVEQACMNENGDLALVWKIYEDGSPNVLFLNGQYLLKEGDFIDWDGDGVADHDFLVTDIGGLGSNLAITEPDGSGSVDVYCRVEIQYPNSFLFSAAGVVIRNAQVTAVPENPVVHASMRYLGAWPSPFNPQTNIAFSVDRSQKVRVDIYGLDGRLVARIADGVFTAGEHRVVWAGRDQAGQRVSSGAYLVRVEAADGVESGKLMLIK